MNHRRFLLILGLTVGLILPPDGSATAAGLPAKRFTTPNGLTVLFRESHSVPIVSIQMIVKAGSVLDPEEKAGLAHMTAALLDEGTRTRSSTQIADELDFLGADLSASGGTDYTTISLRILKKDLPAGFSLLSEIVMQAAFPEAEFQRVRQEILGGLTAEQDQPGVVAEKAFDNLVFGGHPYHRAVEGTEKTIPAITREDVAGFYDRYYRPNNTLLAIVGDLTEKEAADLLKTHLGEWTAKSSETPAVRPAAPLEKMTVKLIDKDLTQANIILGHLGIDRKNPDYYAVLVMNYILGGGGFSSRLMDRIRDNQGLVYSISSRFDARLFPGSFSITLQTRNPTAQKAIDGLLAEIRMIRSAPVTDRELQEAKAFLIGNFPLRMDTNAKIANLLCQMEFYGLGLDYPDRYPKLIGDLTQADLLRAAQKYLSPDRFVLVVVAKQSEAAVRVE